MKNLLHKGGEIDAPVAPDMSTVRLKILIGISRTVELAAELRVLFIKKIILSNGYPVKGRTL